MEWGVHKMEGERSLTTRLRRSRGANACFQSLGLSFQKSKKNLRSTQWTDKVEMASEREGQEGYRRRSRRQSHHWVRQTANSELPTANPYAMQPPRFELRTF